MYITHSQKQISINWDSLEGKHLYLLSLWYLASKRTWREQWRVKARIECIENMFGCQTFSGMTFESLCLMDFLDEATASMWSLWLCRCHMSSIWGVNYHLVCFKGEHSVWGSQVFSNCKRGRSCSYSCPLISFNKCPIQSKEGGGKKGNHTEI